MAFSAQEEELLYLIIKALGGDMTSVTERYNSRTLDLLHAIVDLLSGGGPSSILLSGRAGDLVANKGTNRATFTQEGLPSPMPSADYVIFIQAYSALGTVSWEVTTQDADGFEIDVLEDCYVIYSAIKKS